MAHPNEPAFEVGTEFPIFETLGWPFGLNICNDANFPDAALRISRQGDKLLCYPLNNILAPATAERWRERGLANLKQRAIETGCWVASSDVVGRSGNWSATASPASSAQTARCWPASPSMRKASRPSTWTDWVLDSDAEEPKALMRGPRAHRDPVQRAFCPSGRQPNPTRRPFGPAAITAATGRLDRRGRRSRGWFRRRSARNCCFLRAASELTRRGRRRSLGSVVAIQLHDLLRRVLPGDVAGLGITELENQNPSCFVEPEDGAEEGLLRLIRCHRNRHTPGSATRGTRKRTD